LLLTIIVRSPNRRSRELFVFLANAAALESRSAKPLAGSRQHIQIRAEAVEIYEFDV
jgi:hypothetical protein